MKAYIKQNIYEIMKERSMSTKELAVKSGVAHRRLIDILDMKKTKCNPSFSTLYSIADTLEVRLSDLFIRKEEQGWPKVLDITEEEYLNILRGNFRKKTDGKKHKMISMQPGLSESTISKIIPKKEGEEEKYKINPTIRTLEAISHITETNINRLLTRGGEKE